MVNTVAALADNLEDTVKIKPRIGVLVFAGCPLHNADLKVFVQEIRWLGNFKKFNPLASNKFCALPAYRQS